MKQRKILIVLLTALLLPSFLKAEHIQLLLKGDQASGVVENSATITLAEGDFAELLSYSGTNSECGLQITYNGATLINHLAPAPSESSPHLAHSKFIGPSTICLTNQKHYDSTVYPTKFIALFKVTRADSPEGSIMVPDDDPNATFEVFMEASTDLETWVRVIPGDYDADGAAKFFRVRMIKK